MRNSEQLPNSHRCVIRLDRASRRGKNDMAAGEPDRGRLNKLITSLQTGCQRPCPFQETDRRRHP